VLDENATMPTAVVVNSSDIKTGASLADDYDGVLVTVENVTVLATHTGSVDGEKYNKLTVTGDLRVGNFLFPTLAGTVGDVFTSLTGVMRFNWNHHKLEPRSAADVVKQ